MKQREPTIELSTYSAARVVPELESCESCTSTFTGASTTTAAAAAAAVPKPAVPEQLQLQRSKQRQFVALMKKHYSAYRRDTETIANEIFTVLLYTILLYVFSLTASTEITDSKTRATDPIELTTSTTAAFSVPFNSFNAENYTSACDGQDCYIAFGDTDDGTGCSDELKELLTRIPMCAVPPQQPFFDPETLGCNDPHACGGASQCFSTVACQDRGAGGQWPMSSAFHACNAGAACAPCFGNCNETSPSSTTVSDIFANYTGISMPKCQCFPVSGFNNFTYVQDQHIVAAVHFEPGFGNRSGYNYTMHLSGPKIAPGTTKFKSPLLQSGTSFPQSVQFQSTALQLQVAIDSAITGQDIAVGVARFPIAKIEVWKPGALGNVPLYLTIMLFLGLQSFAGQLAEEGEKGLRQALFMVGLEPVVYWLSWVVILSAKLLVTTTLIFIILGTALPHFDFIGTLIPFVLICVWATEFAIFLGLIDAKPKTAQGAVAFLPPLFAVIPTVLAFMLGNNPDASSVIPGEVHIVLGGIAPPYAFAMVLTEMLSRTNSVDGGLRLQKYGRVGSTDVSPLSMVLCLVAADVVLFGVNWYLSAKNLGIAREKKTDDGENQVAHQQFPGGEDGGVAVSIRGLRKEWGHLKAVDGLTVNFMDNQITGFLGHNGAGKSTTIKLLTGLYSVTGGDAYVYGKSVDQNMSSVREMIGVCPQDNIFWDRLTVYEHLELLAHIRGVAKEEVEGHINVLLQDVGLFRSKGNLGSSLSGGMKRKMCVCMALIGDPKVLFLDEPTAGMDSGARRDVWKLLLRKRAGRCIVLCTHHMDEADILSDRIVVINEGKLQDVGTPTGLKVKYGKHIHLEISVSHGCNRRRVLESIDQALIDAKHQQSEIKETKEAKVTPNGGDVHNHGEGIVCLDLSDHVGDEVELKALADDMLDAVVATDLHLVLPGDADVAVVMEALERAVNDNESKIENYGIATATLSDVFWELDQEAGRRAAALERQEEEQQNSVGVSGTSTSNGRGGKRKEPTLQELVRNTTPPGACVKIMEIMKQRQTSLVRSAWGVPCPCHVRVPVLLRETMYVCAIALGLLVSLVEFDVPLLSGNFVQMGYQDAFSMNDAGRMAVAMDTATATPSNQLGDPAPSSFDHTARALVPLMASLAANDPQDQVPVPVDMTMSAPCMLAALIRVKEQHYCDSNASKEVPKVKESGGYVSPTAAPGGYAAAIEFHSAQAMILNPIEQHVPKAQKPNIKYIVRPNTSNLFALPGIVSFAHSALLYNSTGNANIGIHVNLDVLPTYADTKEAKARLSLSVGLLMVQFRSLLFLMTGQVFTAVAANWVRQLLTQKATHVYQLQILMGIKPSEYLMSNMLFDFLHYLALLVVPLIIVFAVDTPIGHPATVLLCVGFGVAMLPIMYLMSKLFEKPEPAYSFASALFMLVFLVTFMGYFVCAIPDIAKGIDVENVDTVRYIATLWPTTALALGLRAVLLSGTYQYDPLSVSVNATELGLNREGQDISRFLFGKDLPIETAFVPIVVLFAEGLAFFVLVYLVDLGVCTCTGFKVIKRCVHDCRRCACCGCCYGPEPTPFVLAKEDVEDEDVLSERAACSKMYNNAANDEELGGDHQTPAVVLHKVALQYPPSGKQRTQGTLAVHDLSLRIRPKECFSLLGTNGAGKTSTLQMIMQQIALTLGSIEIDGKNIATADDGKFAGMGFCPQKNALLPNHTTKEMLMFYARVRGVPVLALEEYVQQWMAMTRLTPFQHTRCAALSGGNKRKLSLTIAIIGNPTLAVLDEPSAGVDPAARKKLHQVINAVKLNGTTIILTTHHMGEAAKLGDRIGIMVQGRLGCLGTSGHLLNAYSEGYVCTVSMKRGQNVEEIVLPLLRDKCPDLKITNQPNEQYVSVRLGTRDSFSLVEVYKCLDAKKQEGHISFFTVGQANLESIFLRFSALTDATAAREHGDTRTGRGRSNEQPWRPLGHAHLLEDVTEPPDVEEETDGTWGHEWWDSSISRLSIRGDAKITGPGCLFGRYGGFLSQSTVREHSWAQEVPPRLRSRGVAAEEWERFVDGLEQAQRKTSACNVCRCVHCCFIGLSVLTMSWGWLCMCCGWSTCDPYQIAMKKLMDMLNEDVLQPKGIFAKILSFGGINDEGLTPEKSVNSFALPVLVFAFTNKEKRRLEAEQVLHKPEQEKEKNWNCWDCPAHRGRIV